MSTEAVASILIVIPTLNEAHGIEGVVDALCVDLPSKAKVSIVVADGGSTDGTIERVRDMMATRPLLGLLHNPKRIQSAAVNLAARTLGQDAQVLIRCDAHASYPQGFVRRLLDTLDRTGADAVVVPMDSAGSNCWQRAVAWVSDTRVGSGGSAHRGGQRSGFVDHGHHAAFRMASFRRAGAYDESFTHNEDAELDCRQRALGGRIYLDAQIRLGYRPRATAASLARQYFCYGQGRSRTVRRHPGSMRARQLALPVHWALSVLALALAVWWPALLAWPLAYLAVLMLTSIWVAYHQRSLCGLLAGPAAGLMHVSWALGFFAGLATVRESAWQPGIGLPREAGRAGGVSR